MIPKSEEAKIREALIINHIGEEHPAFIAVMKLIAPEAVAERQWVYQENKGGRIVSTAEAKELLATGDYADHPEGHIVASDENNKVTRSWKKLAIVPDEIVYTAENGDTVFVRDQDGNPVGEPQYLKPLSMNDRKDEILARAVGIGIDPPDANKNDILTLIKAERLRSDGVVDPLVTVESSTEELMAAADDLGLIIPENTSKEEAVRIIGEASERARKSEE